jgi:uncharacterized membrane protein YhdT
MNQEQHRRDLVGVTRMFLCYMLFFFLVNTLATSYYQMRGFLFWFNFTCFMGIMIVIGLLDFFKYKIIEGKFK